MTLSLRFAARSDVGLVRQGNEDSGYAGPSLLAVADGMGGHAAGEVASSVAVATLAGLDDDVAGTELLDSLKSAVDEANSTLRDMVDQHPQLEGMGTTLTALLWAGRRLGLVHVGDSRAYLLRDGGLTQITHDHTFVQTLVDEGRITEEEADHHPQRSLIMRALDGRGTVEMDLSVREVRPGDRYLLCSDGLSGVVPRTLLAETLSEGDPETAADKLIELALRGGGPDNVTCIVADVVDSDSRPSTHPVVVGAAAEKGVGSDDTAPEGLFVEDEDAKRGGQRLSRFRRWLFRSLVLVLAFAVVAGGGWAAYAWSQRQYYVGAEDGLVTIFRGLPQELAGRSLSSTHERQDVQLADLPSFEQKNVRETIFAGNLGEAKGIVDQLRGEAQACVAAREDAARKATPTPKPPTPKPLTSAAPSPATTSTTAPTESARPTPRAGCGEPNE
jgi:serine/threonine protein phosphatase PrpC